MSLFGGHRAILWGVLEVLKLCVWEMHKMGWGMCRNVGKGNGMGNGGKRCGVV